jgi:hypothetical protein
LFCSSKHFCLNSSGPALPCIPCIPWFQPNFSFSAFQLLSSCGDRRATGRLRRNLLSITHQYKSPKSTHDHFTRPWFRPFFDILIMWPRNPLVNPALRGSRPPSEVRWSRGPWPVVSFPISQFPDFKYLLFRGNLRQFAVNRGKSRWKKRTPSPADCGLRTVDRGPWTVDRGPWTVDCGPWTDSP